MVQKRPAAAGKGAGKKQKLDPVAQHCARVCDGLGQAAEVEALPGPVLEMLTKMLADSLAVAKDARHKFQESVADMVCGAMATTEASLKQELADAQAAVDGGAEAKVKAEAAVKESQDKLNASQEDWQAKKVALAEAAEAFKNGSASVREAHGAQLLAEADVKEASAKKAALEGALQDFVAPLAEGTVPEADVADVLAKLKGALAKFGMVESLMTALPTALTKAPAERTAFDTMVVTQLRGEVDKLIAPLLELISKGDAVGQEKAAATAAAEKGLEDAKEAQLAAATAFSEAKEALDVAKRCLKEAEQALKELGPESKRNQKTLDAAQGALEAFQAGALASAQELKERLTPPPEPEPAPEEEAAPEAEAAADAAAPPAAEAPAEAAAA